MDNHPTITIFHNPRCSKSRATLDLIRASGYEPDVINYLETPPDRAGLIELLAEMGLSPRDLIRTGEAVYQQFDLAATPAIDSAVADDAVITAMLAHPILINRPIVRTSKGTRLCRPPELVHDILP